MKREYRLTDREGRKFDKYLQKIGVTESDFIARKIRGVIKEIQLDEEIDLIIHSVLEKLELNEEEFFNGSNAIPNPSARRVVSHVLRTHYNCKLKDIGAKINRKHCSIVNHLQWLEDKKGFEHLYPDEFNTIKEIEEEFKL